MSQFQYIVMKKMVYVEAVLIDISGTLLIGNEPTPNAVNAIARLRSGKIPFRIVTNTSKESAKSILARLHQLGFDIKEEEVFTALSATRQLLIQRKAACLFLLKDEVMSDFEGISTESPTSVVIGLAPEMFDYTHMNEAFKVLLKGGSLIAINKSKYFKTEEGHQLATGGIVAALEYSSGCKATVVGKPSLKFYELALESLGVDAANVAMIGDDINDDVRGSQDVGCKGVLVKTGKYIQRVVDESGVKPDVVVESFADFVDSVLFAM
eukprot:m.34223 g.34223  ORF g.34223 m.34223 type:complete len:267 (+) comp6506_c0_seq1:32-832(+)